MLEMLRLRGFKSWADTGRMELRPITGLFGANSSGKTSILQFLLLMKQTAESPDRQLVLDFGDEQSPVSLGSFRDIVFDHSPEGELRGQLEWRLTKPLRITDPKSPKSILYSVESMGFETVISSNGNGSLAVQRFAYHFDGHALGMRRKDDRSPEYELLEDPGGYHFERTVGRPKALTSPSKCYGFPDQVRASYQNAGFLADLQVAFEGFLQGIHYLGPLRGYPERQYLWSGAQPGDVGRRGEQAVNALLASQARGKYISPGPRRPKRSLEEVVAIWLRDLGLISDFRVERIADDSNLYRASVRKTPRSPYVLLTDVGFGVSQVLPILVLCYYVPEGSIVILEQPEIHLHPAVQAGLADVFIDAAKTRGIQVVFESHSEHLLQRLQLRIAEERLPSADAALYFCDFRGDRSHLKRLEVDLFGNITNWPQDFFGDPLGDAAAAAEAAFRRSRGAS